MTSNVLKWMLVALLTALANLAVWQGVSWLIKLFPNRFAYEFLQPVLLSSGVLGKIRGMFATWLMMEAYPFVLIGLIAYMVWLVTAWKLPLTGPGQQTRARRGWWGIWFLVAVVSLVWFYLIPHPLSVRRFLLPSLHYYLAGCLVLAAWLPLVIGSIIYSPAKCDIAPPFSCWPWRRNVEETK